MLFLDTSLTEIYMVIYFSRIDMKRTYTHNIAGYYNKICPLNLPVYLNVMGKPEAHGHNAQLNIRLNRKLSNVNAMTTNQNQSFGQNLHGWKRNTPETCL